ncbi:MAG: hypothetical protein ACQEQH_02685 [Bacillota bacterium]
MFKKMILILILFIFVITPLADAQQHDFQEMNYSVFLQDNHSSLNINPVFQFQNELNRLSFDLNYDGSDFNIKGTWLISFLEGNDYKTEAAFDVLTKRNGSGFTAGLGVEGSRYLQNSRELIYDFKYILDNKNFEYRIGYLTPIVDDNDLMVSLGNSYWHDRSLLLEIGFRAKF